MKLSITWISPHAKPTIKTKRFLIFETKNKTESIKLIDVKGIIVILLNSWRVLDKNYFTYFIVGVVVALSDGAWGLAYYRVQSCILNSIIFYCFHTRNWVVFPIECAPDTFGSRFVRELIFGLFDLDILMLLRLKQRENAEMIICHVMIRTMLLLSCKWIRWFECDWLLDSL